MNDTFMKTRPVFPLLLSMALPNVISMLVNSLYNIVDSLFVAQISEQAMTALSLVFPIQNFVNAVAIGFGIGINAQIALYLAQATTRTPTGPPPMHDVLPAARRAGHGPLHCHHARLPAPLHYRSNSGGHGRDLLQHRVPLLAGQHGRPRL